MTHEPQPRLLALLLLAGAALLIGAWFGAGSWSAAAAPPLTPDAMGGGEFVFGQGDEISAAAEAAILTEIAHNQVRLYRTGKLAWPRADAHVVLARPLRVSASFVDFSYYAITNFVDNDLAFPDSLRDYNNGTRTYDTAGGYNHGGTDYFLWPFSWLKMDHNAVEVIAAADGIIVGKSDGNNDRNCGYTSTPWNAVYVQHTDGTVAWYGHLKKGTLTTKTVGDAVVTGEYLGLIGSSGFSTAPHLHLELRSSGGSGNSVIDPFFGAGNPSLAESLWQSQASYYDSAILHLGTALAAPEFPPCPQQEITNEQEVFNSGDAVYLSVYYRDQLQGQVSELRVLRPSGAVHAAWTHASPAPHYVAAYWWWKIVIPEGAERGEWRFQVTYQGRTYERSFFVGQMPPTTTSPPTPSVTEKSTATATVTVTPTAIDDSTPTPTITGTQSPIPTATATATVTPSRVGEETPNPYPSPVEFTDFSFLPYVLQ